MDDAKEDLEEPLTVESIKVPAKAMGMKMSHDATDHLVWWFDIGKMDIKAIHDQVIPVRDSVRFFVWVAHVCMLDVQAQEHGILFVEDTGYVGFWEMITMFPAPVVTKLDRLTIGVMPVQMKGIYVMHSAGWLKLLLNLMKPFMSKKIRQRIVTIGNSEDASSILTDVVGGKEYIPVDYCGLEGTLEKDIIFGTYIKDA